MSCSVLTFSFVALFPTKISPCPLVPQPYVFHCSLQLSGFVPLFPTKISPYPLVPQPYVFHCSLQLSGFVPLFPQRSHHIPLFPNLTCSIVPYNCPALFPCSHKDLTISPCSLQLSGFVTYALFSSSRTSKTFNELLYHDLHHYYNQ